MQALPLEVLAKPLAFVVQRKEKSWVQALLLGVWAGQVFLVVPPLVQDFAHGMFMAMNYLELHIVMRLKKIILWIMIQVILSFYFKEVVK